MSLIHFQEIVSALRDETRNPAHKDFGMFVLVVMSHGSDNDCIYGVDGSVIKLTEVYDLLSSTNFPMMADKPKLVIVQACSGGK